MNKFTERLNELIEITVKERNIKQGTICKELNLTPQQLTNWKKGYNEPRSIDDLIMLADYFNVCIDYLVGRQDWY